MNLGCVHTTLPALCFFLPAPGRGNAAVSFLSDRSLTVLARCLWPQLSPTKWLVRIFPYTCSKLPVFTALLSPLPEHSGLC